ncbi:MAG: hypothetical protein PVH88_16230 [Ignavibacteria bacterium]|jgi:hypothetical protein
MKFLFLTLILAFSASLYAQNLISPSDLAIGVEVIFDWDDYTFESDVRGEDDYYVVKIGMSSGASNIYSTTSTVSTESIDLDAAGVSYRQLLYWEVEAYDDGVLAYTYSGFTFITEGFGLVSPVNGLIGVSIQPEFVWSNEGGDIPDATTFTIEIDDDSDFSNRFC